MSPKNTVINNISVVGIGRLGLCFALGLERKGFNVIGVDLNPEYVRQINEKTHVSHEPGVSESLGQSKGFLATTDISLAVNHSDLIFVLVATPSLPDDSYDHSQINSVIDEIKKLGLQSHIKHLVISCTTMPGFCDTVDQDLMSLNWVVTYNPEFIAQGSIMRDLLQPDIVLIGESDTQAGQIIESVYLRLCDNIPLVHHMGILSAEITKLALNCYLTTKIAFANMIGDLALKAGAEVEDILKAIGSDKRVGDKYFSYGYGYGGPCLPRDNRALRLFAEKIGVRAEISKAVDIANSDHLKFQLEDFCKKNDLKKTVNLGPLTYKSGTPSLENSQQLEFALGLTESGYKVVVKDRVDVILKLQNKYPGKFEFIEI